MEKNKYIQGSETMAMFIIKSLEIRKAFEKTKEERDTTQKNIESIKWFQTTIEKIWNE